MGQSRLLCLTLSDIIAQNWRVFITKNTILFTLQTTPEVSNLLGRLIYDPGSVRAKIDVGTSLII